jgi:hypothetical protein
MRICNKDGTVNIYNIDDIRKLTFSGITGINDPKFNTVIKNFNLLKTYPNPFRNSTSISYSLPNDGIVEISIVDLNGKVIKTYPGENQSPGEQTLTWDGTTSNNNKALPGIYICIVKFNDQLVSNKMLLIK